jgi:hypothetical protein
MCQLLWFLVVAQLFELGVTQMIVGRPFIPSLPEQESFR